MTFWDLRDSKGPILMHQAHLVQKEWLKWTFSVNLALCAPVALDCESPNGLAAQLSPAHRPRCAAATAAAVIVCRPMAGMLFPAFSIGFSPSYYNYSKRHARRRRRNYSPRVALVQASAARRRRGVSEPRAAL